MKKTFTLFVAFVFAATALMAQGLTFDWATTAGGDAGDFGEGVTVDEAGNTYVAGHFRNEMTFLGTSIESDSERNIMFLAKISPAMDLQWIVTAEADGVTGASGYRTAYHNGHVYLFGDFRGDATFSSTDFTDVSMNSETRALFVAKYTDDGVLEWIRKMESSNAGGLLPTGSANNLVVDDAGAVYVTTQFRTDIDIAGTLVDPDGSGGTNFHALLVKFDALGAYQWHWNSTHPGDDRGEAITTTPEGNVLFAVRYNDALTVNDVMHEADNGAIALIEVEADGTHVWDHHVQTAATNQANFWDMRFCANDNLYIAGASRTTLTWDDDTEFAPANPMRTQAFVIKLDANNSLQWAEFFGDPDENTIARSIRTDHQGQLFIAGEHIGTMVLNDDLTVVSNDGSRDIFYAVMHAVTGDFLAAGAFGGTGNEFMGTMDLSPNHDVYFIGRYLGDFEAGGETFPSEGSFDFFVVKMTAEEAAPPADPDELELVQFFFFGGNLPNNTPLETIEPTFDLVGDALISFHSALEGYPFDSDHPNWRKASMERRNAATEINYHPEGNDDIPYDDSGIRGMQVKQPFTGDGGENTLFLHMPTTGYEHIIVRFAAMDEGDNDDLMAAEELLIDYAIADDDQWHTDGLSETVLSLLHEEYQLFTLDFSGIDAVNDNSHFVVRIRFAGPNMDLDDGDRVAFNNMSMQGVKLPEPATFTVTFTVEDEAGDPIPDAVITLEDIENEPGDYVFTGLIAGTYNYHVAAHGYEEATGSVEVTDQDVNQNVVLTEGYVEVETLIELRGMPSDGTIYRYTGEAVLVAMDGFRNRKFLQDETAAIMIDDQPGTITTEFEIYDVITNVVGIVNVHNNMVQFQPQEDAPEATENTPIDAAVFAIGDLSPNDQAKLVQLLSVTFLNAEEGDTFANGTNYTITDGENELTVRTDFWNVDYIGEQIPLGAINLGGVIIQHFDNLQLVPRFADDFAEVGFTLTFEIEDESGDPIPDAVITLNEMENDPGDYVFTGLQPGDYDYTVVAIGFAEASGNVSIVDSDVSETIVLQEIVPDTHALTFIVEDEEGVAIDDAVITLDGVANEPGDYLFPDLQPGDYAYTVAAGGFVEASGNVSIVDSDVSKTVVLQLHMVSLPYEENFDDAPLGNLPEYWQRTHNNWSVHGTNNAGGEAGPELRFNWSPADDDTFRAITPLLDGSGLDDIMLMFMHSVNDYAGGYMLKVETSLDGETWIEQWSLEIDEALQRTPAERNTAGGRNNVPPTQEALMLDGVGNEQFHIAFTFEGNSFDINQWYIDDIYVGEEISNEVVFHVKEDSQDEDPIAGATITVNGEELTTDENGLAAINLNYGTYAAIIQAAGYVTEEIEFTVAGTDLNIDIHMLDVIVDPFDLEVLTEGYDLGEALFQWNHAGEKAFLGFDVFLNDDLVGQVAETQYFFTDLPTGEHVAGVRSVYTTGMSDIITIGFEVEEDEPDLFEVTFNVELTKALQFGLLEGFDPDIHHIFMTGNMFGWAEPGSDPDQTMEHISDDPHVYSLTMHLEAGTYEYKYFSDLLGDGWDGGEWPGDPNRVVEVTGEMTVEDMFGPDDLDVLELDDIHVMLYPNPARSTLNIQSSEQILSIRMVDMLGQVVLSQTVQDTLHQIEVSGYQTGVYFIQLTTRAGVITHRVQVTR